MLDLSQLRETVRYEGGVSRRLFVAYGAALASLPLLAEKGAGADSSPSFSDDPFALGVASGDPTPDGVVLWTKLVPKPLEPDGGMKPSNVVVGWEVAEDEGMRTIVASGKAIATPPLGHTVHVEARGLKPDRWYWYRFKCGAAVSPIGRTRTFPAADATPEKLRFAFTSCQHFEQGWYAGYRQMAQDQLDLVIHLGDYIYEGPGRDGLARKHNGPKSSKIKTLAEYRGRHMQYRTDPLLRGMHQQCPWIVTWDDHEVENNYANAIQENQPKGLPRMDPADFLIRRAAAYQAYYEMMPLRASSLPRGPAMQLYRTASFGRLAEFLVLDTRQYRTDQPNNDGIHELNAAAMSRDNTILGSRQRGWLQAKLLASTATWNVLAQQVMMALVELRTARERGFSMDKWPGYAHERIELMRFIADRHIPNPVVLTGDIHSNWVNELRVDDRRHDEKVVATEFVGTSMTSGGNGSTNVPGLDALKSHNPCVKFHNRERGYVRCEVTPTKWTSDYVVVEKVTLPDSPVLTRASYVIEAGQPGAHPV